MHDFSTSPTQAHTGHGPRGASWIYRGNGHFSLQNAKIFSAGALPPRPRPLRRGGLKIGISRYSPPPDPGPSRSTHIRSPWCSGSMSSGHVPSWCTALVEVDASGPSPVPRRDEACDAGPGGAEPFAARVPALLQLQHSKSVLLRRRRCSWRACWRHSERCCGRLRASFDTGSSTSNAHWPGLQSARGQRRAKVKRAAVKCSFILSSPNPGHPCTARCGATPALSGHAQVSSETSELS